MMISLSDVEDSKLLFDPFSLTSREKKRIQVVILQNIIRQIKVFRIPGIFVVFQVVCLDKIQWNI